MRWRSSCASLSSFIHPIQPTEPSVARVPHDHAPSYYPIFVIVISSALQRQGPRRSRLLLPELSRSPSMILPPGACFPRSQNTTLP